MSIIEIKSNNEDFFETIKKNPLKMEFKNINSITSIGYFDKNKYYKYNILIEDLIFKYNKENSFLSNFSSNYNLFCSPTLISEVIMLFMFNYLKTEDTEDLDFYTIKINTVKIKNINSFKKINNDLFDIKIEKTIEDFYSLSISNKNTIRLRDIIEFIIYLLFLSNNDKKIKTTFYKNFKYNLSIF